MHKEFKVTNHRWIRLLAILLSVLILLSIMLLIFCLTFSLRKIERISTVAVMAVVIFYLSIVLFRMKFFEIESSGAVCSIKRYSIYKSGWIPPILEFPVDVLIGFSLEGNCLSFKLNRDQNIYTAKFHVAGLGKKQRTLLQEHISGY